MTLFLELVSCFHSGDETETDSEIEDRVDGVKSWLSKNKTTAKTPSEEGSLKSARLVLISSVQHDREPCTLCPCGNVAIRLSDLSALKGPKNSRGM